MRLEAILQKIIVITLLIRMLGNTTVDKQLTYVIKRFTTYELEQSQTATKGLPGVEDVSDHRRGYVHGHHRCVRRGIHDDPSGLWLERVSGNRICDALAIAADLTEYPDTAACEVAPILSQKITPPVDGASW